MSRYQAYIGVLPQSSLARILSESYTTPLGQLILGTSVQRRSPQTKVAVFDPLRTPPMEMWKKIQEIHSRYEPILVGLSLLSGNSEHAFKLAQQCTEEGMDVIIGGPETTGYGAVNIMQTRLCIKYGVNGVGERILPELVIGTALENIPGLVYRDSRDIKQNPIEPRWAKLDWLNVTVDYNLLDNITGNVGTTYLMGNDCFIADKRCYFCGRIGMGNPQNKEEIENRVEKAWKEIGTAWNAGLTHYFNSADSALRNPKLFGEFAEAMPNWFKPWFHHLFANAHEITPEVIPLLKKLNATVYLGVENTAIENYGKGKIRFKSSECDSNTSNSIYSQRAIAFLNECEIPLRLSFVFGGPGESKDTLAKNLDTIVEMVQKYSTITDLELNPIGVYPGTQAFRDLMRVKPERYSNLEVPYDTREMSIDLVPLISQVNREEVLEWIAKMYQAVKSVKPEIRTNTKGLSWEEYVYLGGK